MIVKVATAPFKHVQIAGFLREEMLSGRLAPGSRLASVRDLKDEFSVSKGVISLALDILDQEGLISRKDRSGVFVAERLRKPPVGLVHELRPSELATQGFFPTLFDRLSRLVNQDGHEFQTYPLDTPIVPWSVRQMGGCELPDWLDCGNPVLPGKLAEGSLGGLLVFLAPYRNLAAAVAGTGRPAALCWLGRENPEGLRCVSIDFSGDQSQALDHLLASGCRRILEARLVPFWLLDELRARAAQRGATIESRWELKGADPKDYDGAMIGDDNFAMENMDWLLAFGDFARMVVRVYEGGTFPLPTVRLEIQTSQIATTLWGCLKNQMEGGSPPPGIERVPSRLIAQLQTSPVKPMERIGI